MTINENTKKSLKRLTVSAFFICAFLAGVYFLLKHFGITSFTKEQLQQTISSAGAIAPIAFIFASFLQVTVIPIPSTVTIVVGSFLFGPVESFFYSYIGIMLGSWFAYFLGRALGRPYINWVAGGREEADEWLAKLKGREKIFLFFAFLFPLFPDDFLCSLAGMVSMKFATFTIMQLVTRTTTIGVTILCMSGELIPYEGWGLWLIGGLFALAIVAFIFSMIYAEKLNAIFEAVLKKAGSLFRRKSRKSK